MSMTPFLATVEVSPLLIFPFALLLLLIATMPLSPPAIKHVWDRFYPHISVGLALLVAGVYVATVDGGVAVLRHTAADYLGFISLIGSLYVVAGGIHIKVKGESTPLSNLAFLAIGAFAANVIGTTGASMVLIRPWIRMNKIRISPFHVVFFIFVVSNIGGALTPVGDPPLFLGYLRGVPFFWLVQHVMIQWLVTVSATLAAFYVFDLRSFKHMPRKIQREVMSDTETWKFEGAVNVLLIPVIIGAVFLPDNYFLRESLMVGAAIASWFLTPKVVHAENQFTFGPIKEVALLFVGIFGTMMPVLEYLQLHGQAFGLTHPLHYYFASGSLSAVLDNAPTYVNFLQLAQTTAIGQAPVLYAASSGSLRATTGVLLGHQPLYVIAVSLGSVFFGAMTYIGNGPNFMVKSIAHDAGVHCPTFFGYIVKFSLPVLLPILAVVGWIFLR